MILNLQQKENLKKELTACLREEPEIVKIVIFGSFLTTDSPHDLDVAVFQSSTEPYLPLAMKYRRKTRSIARKIPLDIIPLRPCVADNTMLDDISHGEVIYER